MATKSYVTIQGDTWDGIAAKVYGQAREKEMIRLIEQNPTHRLTVIFSGGVEIDVPDLPAQSSVKLAPWRKP